MFRAVAFLIFLSLLVGAGPGGAMATPADRQDGPSGLPRVTYEEIVGQPRGSAGYSFEAIALGAVAGVMAANTVLPMLGYTAVSAALAGSPVTGATLEAALATSRLVAVGAAAAGGAIGQWLYSGQRR